MSNNAPQIIYGTGSYAPIIRGTGSTNSFPNYKTLDDLSPEDRALVLRGKAAMAARTAAEQ